MSVEWWLAKLSALIHDPPWKYWLVTGLSKRWCSEDRLRELNLTGVPVRELSAHEVDSLCIAANFGVRWTELEGLKSVIAGADRKASALDRVLSGLIPRGIHANRLVNVFRPKWSVDVGEYREGYASNFMKLIRDLANEVRGSVSSREEALKYIYMLLYVGMEKLWRDASNHLNAPLADSRSPTHTIFDHLHTTALSVNSVATGEWVVIMLSIPGIQGFISKGRKTRDFWAGSWILSLITWKLIEDLVDKFGPDIVVSPSLTVNPFFISYLRSKGLVKGSGNAIRRSIPDILLIDDWPSQPVMPASNIVLLLPLPSRKSPNKELNDYVCNAYRELMGSEFVDKVLEGVNSEYIDREFRRYFKEGLRKAWRLLAESVLTPEIDMDGSVVRGYIMGVCRSMMSSDASNDDLRTCVEFVKDKLIKPATKEPPFEVVTAVAVGSEVLEMLKNTLRSKEVKEELKDFVEEFNEAVSQLRNIAEKQGLGEIYDPRRDVAGSVDSWVEKLISDTTWLWIAELTARSKAKDRSFVRVFPGALIYGDISEFTNKVYKAGTSESSLPKTMRRWRTCTVCGVLPAAVMRGRVGEEGYEGYILLDEGEALCPYCLIRRLVSRNPHRVVKKVLNIKSTYGLFKEFESKEAIIPSTLDIANFWILPNIVRDLKEVRELAKEVIDREGAGRYEKGLLRVLKQLGNDKIYRYIDDMLSLLNKAKKISEDGLRELRKWVGEGLTLSRGAILEHELSLRKELRGRLQSRMTLYLAYVKGDADCVGRGYHGGVFEVANEYLSPEDYISEIISSSGITLSLEKGLERDLVGAYARAYGSLVRAISKVMHRLLGVEDHLKLALITTPSYKFTLSKSLSLIALTDSLIIESLGGVTVYSGGDDVAALLPVTSPEISIDIKGGNGGAKIRYINPAILSACGVLLRMFNVGSDKLSDKLIERIVKVLTGMNDLGSFASPALLMVMLTRLNYWGLLRSLVTGRVKGFHVLSGLVVAAPAWYGRSYMVVITHYRDPMWAAFSVAGELDEVKGRITRSDGLIKDVIYASYGRLGGALLSTGLESSSSILMSNAANDAEDPVKPLRLANALAAAIASHKGMASFSKSLIYDAGEYARIIRRVRDASDKVIESLIKRLLSSNELSAGKADEFINKLSDELKVSCRAYVTLSEEASKPMYAFFEALKLAGFVVRV